MAEVSLPAGRRTPTVAAPLPGRRFAGPRSWLGSSSPVLLVGLLAVLTFGPLVLLSGLSIAISSSELTAVSQRQLEGQAQLGSVYVANQMGDLAQLVESNAQRPLLIHALGDGNHLNYDEATIEGTLDGLASQQRGIQFASIVDSDGRFWLASPPSPQIRGQDFSYRDWYQGVNRTGATYVSSAYAAATAGAPLVIGIATPVRSDGTRAPKGQVVGLLLVAYQLTATQTVVADFAKSQGVDIEVTDQHGVIVAQPGAAPTKLVIDGDAGVTAALSGRRTIDHRTVAGTDYFEAHAPVAGIGWTVAARLPSKIVLGGADRLRLYVLLITTLLLGVLAVSELLVYLALTDRRAVQLQLRAANDGLEKSVAVRTAELEASNRELEAFSYSVSHDLRTPLRAIDGFSRLLLEENGVELSAEAVHRLQVVRDGAQQMGSLIDDLLSFSRIGRLELKTRDVSVVSLVEEVVDELREAHPGREVEVTMGDLPPCRADASLLKQVFRNLLGNAFKFTGTQGHPRIEVGWLHGPGEGGDGTVTYYVKDNGVGFDMQYKDKLFGVFQRLHRAEDFPGTGVGLALVRRIVERHGGRVGAEGALGHGATFFVRLERADATN